MRIALELAPGQPRGVEQAGVVELVLHADIAVARAAPAAPRGWPGSRCQNSSARDSPIHSASFALERVVLGMVAADQMRTGAADAVRSAAASCNAADHVEDAATGRGNRCRRSSAARGRRPRTLTPSRASTVRRRRSARVAARSACARASDSIGRAGCATSPQAAQAMAVVTGGSPCQHVDVRPCARPLPASHRHRPQAEAREQRLVALDVGVAGGQQLLAVEDRIGAGQEAQRLQLVAHLGAAGRQPHHRRAASAMRATAIVRTNSNGIELRGAVQRRAFDLHQAVDRHRVRDARAGWPASAAGRRAARAISPMPTMPPQQVFRPASRTCASVSRRSWYSRVWMISP